MPLKGIPHPSDLQNSSLMSYLGHDFFCEGALSLFRAYSQHILALPTQKETYTKWKGRFYTHLCLFRIWFISLFKDNFHTSVVIRKNHVEYLYVRIYCIYESLWKTMWNIYMWGYIAYMNHCERPCGISICEDILHIWIIVKDHVKYLYVRIYCIYESLWKTMWNIYMWGYIAYMNHWKGPDEKSACEDILHIWIIGKDHMEP